MTNPIVTSFNREVAKQAGDQLKALLASAESANFEFEVGSGRFSSSELTMTVSIKIKGGIDPARQRVEAACKLFGYDPDATLESDKGAFKIVDYSNRSPKYPWIIQYLNGKGEWKYPHASIELAFRRLADKK